MKMEVVNLGPEKRRVLLLFDAEGPSPQDEAVDAYLHAQGLEPRRQYRETRDGREYFVYYFGHCYVEDHLDRLAAMAEQAVGS